MNKRLNLIILGPQGSGKGTQANLLAQKFGYKIIGAGESLREIAKQDTELGRLVHQTINVQGRLVDPKLISQVMKEKLSQIAADQPVLIDSYPRSLAQYGFLKEFWPTLQRGDYQVIFLELSDTEAVKRLSTRFICENCGEIYIGQGNGICVKCGGKLYQREDDKPEAVKVRLGLFNSETRPMIEEMQREGKVIRIDAAVAIEEVHNNILAKLGLI